jgi:methylglutaconyl-CoA hydratase
LTAEKNLETISYSFKDRIAAVTLNRPEVHNAFNEVMIAECASWF